MKELEIRAEQWRAFEDDAERRFEDLLFETIRRSWPEVCERLGDEDAKGRIEEAVDRARHYGWTEQDHITRFTHIAFMCFA